MSTFHTINTETLENCMRLDEILTEVSRRNFLKGTAALIGGTVTSPTLAKANWILFSHERGNDIYYDTVSIRQRGDMAEIWTKVVWPTGKIKSRRDPAFALVKYRFNCKDRTGEIVQANEYDFNHNERIEGSSKQVIPFGTEHIIPDSFLGDLFDVACLRQ